MKKNVTPISYSDYLKTNGLLGLQTLRSTEFGVKAHDELLFIVVHQTYELWFKQILHELQSVLDLFASDFIKESDMGTAVARLSRIVEIQRLLVDQVSVLETMTPLDFLDFRDLLYPASGFQSFQWRLIENKLGLRADKRLKYNSTHYTSHVAKTEAEALLRSETEPSLFDRVDAWLSRAPFLQSEDYQFKTEYKNAVEKMLAEDREAILTYARSDEDRERNLKQIESTHQIFQSLLDPDKFEELRQSGAFRLSYKSVQAALLILLYRDQPLLSLPFQLLTKLQDIDELMTTWRYRHSLMAHRMLGSKIGTGGSSGHQYLKAATDHHRVFSDLFNLATFLIPRSRLPDLPESLSRRLSFR